LDTLVGELKHAGVRHKQVEQLARDAAESVTRVEGMKEGVEGMQEGVYESTQIILDASNRIHADLETVRGDLGSVDDDLQRKFKQLEDDLYTQVLGIFASFGTNITDASKAFLEDAGLRPAALRAAAGKDTYDPDGIYTTFYYKHQRQLPPLPTGVHSSKEIARFLDNSIRELEDKGLAGELGLLLEQAHQSCTVSRNRQLARSPPTPIPPLPATGRTGNPQAVSNHMRAGHSMPTMDGIGGMGYRQGAFALKY